MCEKKIPKFHTCPFGGLFWPLQGSYGPYMHATGLKVVFQDFSFDSGPFEKKDDLVKSSRSRDLTQKAIEQMVKMMEIAYEQ